VLNSVQEIFENPKNPPFIYRTRFAANIWQIDHFAKALKIGKRLSLSGSKFNVKKKEFFCNIGINKTNIEGLLVVELTMPFPK